MATNEMHNPITPPRMMIGLAVAFMASFVGALVTSAPFDLLFRILAITLLVYLAFIGGAFWRERRRNLSR